MDDVEVCFIQTASEMAEALSIRRAVFIEEQAVPEVLEIDEHDGDPATVTSALHVLVRYSGIPVATGRLLLDGPPKENAHIGRVAVRRDYRDRGFGRLVMIALQEEARRRGLPGITLAAQLHAIGFYERLGYRVYGEVLLDAGIEHRWMDLTLA